MLKNLDNIKNINKLNKLQNKKITKFYLLMFDLFTPQNYLYGGCGNNLILRDFLRDCKTDEEKKEAIRVFQKVSILTVIVGGILGLLFCAIVSLF